MFYNHDHKCIYAHWAIAHGTIVIFLFILVFVVVVVGSVHECHRRPKAVLHTKKEKKTNSKWNKIKIIRMKNNALTRKTAAHRITNKCSNVKLIKRVLLFMVKSLIFLYSFGNSSLLSLVMFFFPLFNSVGFFIIQKWSRKKHILLNSALEKSALVNGNEYLKKAEKTAVTRWQLT